MNHTAIFEEQISLTPRDLSREISSIDEELAMKLKKNLEGKCSRHGYVIPGTINILSRSMGSLEKGRFTGSILFYVQAEGDVLNPPEGSILEGTVIRKNKMGIYASYNIKGGEDAIRVIVPRDLHIGSDEFEKVEIGQHVRVQIKKSRFQINDPYILSVGIFLSVVNKGELSGEPGAVGPLVDEAEGEQVTANDQGAQEEGEEEGGEDEEDEEDEYEDEDEEEEGGEEEEVFTNVNG